VKELSLDNSGTIVYSYYGKEFDMSLVTVSPKYQVVIPRSVRERMGLRPGEKLQVLCFEDRIELVRSLPMRKMKGFLKGFDAGFEREGEDRL